VLFRSEWENLHLACPNCNRAKDDKWDDEYSILDAVIDVPISNYLSYRGCLRTYTHKRGKTTRDHTDLNRDELLDAREILYSDVMRLIEMYNNNPDLPDAQNIPRKLKKLSRGQFGSFVQYLKNTYLKVSNG